MVIVMRFPERNSGFCPLNVFIRLLFKIVEFQVTVAHDVVLTKTVGFACLASPSLRIIRLRAFLGCCEVVLFHFDIADDVVIRTGVLSRTEVPLFLLGVVRSLLKALHLTLKVHDVVSLLVSKGAVLIVVKSEEKLPCFLRGHR
jgi:hypothetical protein